MEKLTKTSKLKLLFAKVIVKEHNTLSILLYSIIIHVPLGYRTLMPLINGFVYTQPQTEYNIHWIPKNYHEETGRL